MPEQLVAILHVIRVLLVHGHRLFEIAKPQTRQPAFTTVAAVLGTFNVDVIQARVWRGIMRLIALQKYLLERAHKGSDLPSGAPRTAKSPKDSRATTTAPRRRPFDPDSLHIPTFAEMEAEVRRQPVGRSLTYACMDIAVVPGFCTSDLWTAILEILQGQGGSLRRLFKVRDEREETFKDERERYPDSWDWKWHDLRPDIVRQVLGYVLGEKPPDPLVATAVLT